MGKQAKQVYEFGPFRLDPASHQLLRDGLPVPLKPKLLDLLVVLVKNSGRVVDKDDLMKTVWPDRFVEESNLTVSIFSLRKALYGEDGHSFIETVPRRGYRFIADVKEQWRETPRQLNTTRNSGITITGKASACIDEKSIAVLPFNFIGTETKDEYLGLGMADALITKLTNLRQLLVRPTSAIRKYVGAGQDPVAAGRELTVAAVLDGSIQMSGKRMRVTVQLINVKDSVTLWAGKFDQRFTNILAVEDSISEQVAKALQVRITGEERRLLDKRSTDNPEAYLSYLKGRFFFNKRTIRSLERAIYYFNQAIKLDANCAIAYAGLADAYLIMSGYNDVVSPTEFYPKAEGAALKALKIDETLAEAHTSLAHLKTHCWDWAGAEREFQRAIELNPRDPISHRWYSILLRVLGRSDEAQAEAEKARELDPVSAISTTSIGGHFYLSRSYDKAVTHLQNALELDPDFVLAHCILGLTYEQKKMYEKAIAQYQEGIRILGTSIELLGNLGHTHAIFGRRDEAKKILTELVELSTHRHVSAYNIALIYIGLGEKDQAFAFLEKAYQQRSSDMGMLKVDPRLDGLRRDPRFTDLLERIGLQ